MRCLHSEEQIGRMVEIISIVALLLTRSNNAKHVILQCFNQFSPSQNMVSISDLHYSASVILEEVVLRMVD